MSEFQKKLDGLEETSKKDYGKLKTLYKQEYKSLDKEEYHEKLKSQFQIDENHLAIVSSVISLFISIENLGYKYVTVEPVDEINNETVKNFDILFAKYEDHGTKIILVEVKSSISKIGKEINDFEKTKDVYRGNKDIFDKLVGEDITDAEFVFAIPLSYKDDLIRHIKNNNLDLEDFIIWSVDAFTNNIREIKQSDNHTLERDRRRVHHDVSLDGLFRGQQYNLIPLSFTHKSHTINILAYFYQELYHKLKQSRNSQSPAEFIFHKNELKLLVSDNRATSNLTNEQHSKFVKSIIKLGIEYEIFTQVPVKDEYKLKRTNDPYKIKEYLKKTYVERKMRRDAEKSALEKFNALIPDEQVRLSSFF